MENYLPDDEIEAWELERSNIPYSNIKTIKELAIQLRHCVAHFDIKFEPNDEQQIDKLIFSDNKYGKGVIAEFGIDDFKKFVESLANTLVKNAKQRLEQKC